MELTLDRVKQHLNIEPDYTVDDEYIKGLMAVAESAVKVHCNEEDGVIADAEGGWVAPICQAMLLMIGQMYQNREISGSKTDALPFSYQYLIDLYRNYNR